ncbi:MAG: methyltransferase [Saprospirales bacterium]|nr:methyltransferase [Saprospirales bacterium]
MPKDRFRFQQFTILQDRCLMKVGTDGVLLGAWTPVEGAKTILDIGTGTGLIALMLAQRAPGALIHAVELDAPSAEQAAENAIASPWGDRVSVIPQGIQEFALHATTRYDLIVSNPPFFYGGLKSPRAERNRVRHAETLTFGELLKTVAHLLAPTGRFCVILPQAEGTAFQQIALSFGLFHTRIREVCGRSGKPVERLLLQFERESRPVLREPLLSIYDETPGIWTEAFNALTGGYYL